MKTSTFFRTLVAVGLFVISTSGLFAQALTGPAGTMVLTTDAGQGTEYVTEGSTMPYQVTAFDWGILAAAMDKSEFKWTVVGTGATIYQNADAGTTLTSGTYISDQTAIRIKWPAAASSTTVQDFSISVNEKSVPKSGLAGCEGTATTLPVKVLPWPTVAWGTFTDPSTCGLTGNVTLNVNYTGSNVVTINYEVVYTPFSTGTPGAPQPGSITPDFGKYYDGSAAQASTISIPVTATNYGKYEVTITNISDKVTAKSFSAAQAPAASFPAASSKMVFYNIPTPTTGPIQHLQNL